MLLIIILSLFFKKKNTYMIKILDFEKLFDFFLVCLKIRHPVYRLKLFDFSAYLKIKKTRYKV